MRVSVGHRAVPPPPMPGTSPMSSAPAVPHPNPLKGKGVPPRDSGPKSGGQPQ